MEISEMRVGIFGFKDEYIQKLNHIFKEVKYLSTVKDDGFDALIINISYASSRIFSYIARNSPTPLVITSLFQESIEKLNFLPKEYYMKIEDTAFLAEEQFKVDFTKYFKDFEQKKDAYAAYDPLTQKREVETLNHNMRRERKLKRIAEHANEINRTILQCGYGNTDAEYDRFANDMRNMNNMTFEEMLKTLEDDVKGTEDNSVEKNMRDFLNGTRTGPVPTYRVPDEPLKKREPYVSPWKIEKPVLGNENDSSGNNLEEVWTNWINVRRGLSLSD